MFLPCTLVGLFSVSPFFKKLLVEWWERRHYLVSWRQGYILFFCLVCISNVNCYLLYGCQCIAAACVFSSPYRAASAGVYWACELPFRLPQSLSALSFVLFLACNIFIHYIILTLTHTYTTAVIEYSNLINLSTLFNKWFHFSPPSVVCFPSLVCTVSQFMIYSEQTYSM